ncbi:MAG: ABC transporter substrate-binding protein [Desulfobacterales bacterium]|jgi:phospholipid transport system substrate-binding protein
MNTSIKIFYNAVLGLLILSHTVAADDKTTAENALKSKLNAAIAVLQKEDVDLQVKTKEIEEIMAPMFDFSLMAKLTLGRNYWPKLNNGDRQRFIKLFTQVFKTSYLQKLIRYTDEKIIFEAPIQIKNKVQIPTHLVSKDQKTSILYKLYESQSNWKIYDIEIQGVSIIRSYRSQFIPILQNGTIEDLMQELEKSVNN